MPKHILFISDVHLQKDDDDLAEVFRSFLKSKASKASAIYLLGDIFDAWLGDDQQSCFPKTMAALQQASNHTSLYFMHGNHDFLFGQSALNYARMKGLSDPCVIKPFDENILLTHGDLLCVNDEAYQRYRRVIQHPFTQSIFLMMPLAWRKRLAKKLQSNSQHHTAKKSTTRMDVCDRLAQQWLRQHKTPIMIHGHTHKPAKHTYQNGLCRYVLGAWHDAPQALQLDFQGNITSLTIE